MTCTLTLGSDTLDLTGTNGYYVRSIDPGFPQIREVSAIRPDANGADDTTAYFGPRVVSLDIVCNGTRQTLIDNLSKFLLPTARPVLTVDDRRITLRPANRAVALTAPAHVAQVQLQFVAPSGVWESTTETTAETGPISSVGRDYPETRPRSYAPTLPAGALVVTVSGTAPTYPVVTIYGPLENPKLTNITTGAELNLTATLGDGEYFVIDFRDRTIFKNGDRSQSYLSSLDWLTSSWAPLAPGDNRFRLAVDDGDPATLKTVVKFRNFYL